VSHAVRPSAGDFLYQIGQYVRRPSRLFIAALLLQLAQRLHLVERADELPFEPAAVEALYYHYQFPWQPDGSTVFFWELASRTH
jgi:hypothetical protein